MNSENQKESKEIISSELETAAEILEENGFKYPRPSIELYPDFEDGDELVRKQDAFDWMLDLIDQRIQKITSEDYWREETEIDVDSVQKCENTEVGELCEFCWMKECLYHELEGLRSEIAGVEQKDAEVDIE